MATFIHLARARPTIPGRPVLGVLELLSAINIVEENGVAVGAFDFSEHSKTKLLDRYSSCRTGPVPFGFHPVCD